MMDLRAREKVRQICRQNQELLAEVEELFYDLPEDRQVDLWPAFSRIWTGGYGERRFNSILRDWIGYFRIQSQIES